MEEQGVHQEAQNVPPDEDIKLLDYIPVVWKYRVLVGIVFLITLLYGVIPALLAPRVYQASAMILRDTGGQELSLASLLAQQIAMSRGSSSPGRGDNILNVLRSRTLAEEMVKRLKLQEYYGVSRLQDAAGLLRASTKVFPQRDGPIEIRVEDKDPKKAAEVTNAYADSVNRHMIFFSSSQASRQRIFIVERLKETEKALKEAEEALKTFQEKNRAVVITAQTTEAISAAAGLRAQLIATEVELKNLRSFATESNPEVIRLKGRIAELKRQIGQAQYGAGLDLPAMSQNPGHPQKEIYLPAARVPEIQLEFTRLTRDVKVHEAVYTLLTQQLEQAKITEAQDVPVVRLLDPALPPESPKPRKVVQTMAIYGVVGIFAGIFLALAFDYSARTWPEIKSRIRA